MTTKKKGRKVFLYLIVGVVIIIVLAIAFSGNNESKTKNTISKTELENLLKKATEAYDTDNYKEAVSLYKKVIENGIQDGIVLYRYAYSTLKTKGYDPNLYIKSFIALANQDPKNKYTSKAFNKIKENAVVLDYRKAMLKDYKDDTIVTVTGGVLQILEDTNVLLDTAYDNVLGYTGDRVWLVFENKPRILEDDILVVVGYYKGTKKYTTVLGTEAEVPYIKVIGFQVFENN